MVRSRLIATALLGFGVVLSLACTAKQQNGQECLTSDDCESKRCVQYVCIDPNASRPTPTATTDAGAGEAATDSGAASEAGADTGAAPSDTGPADTGSAPADTGSAPMDAAAD